MATIGSNVDSEFLHFDNLGNPEPLEQSFITTDQTYEQTNRILSMKAVTTVLCGLLCLTLASSFAQSSSFDNELVFEGQNVTIRSCVIDCVDETKGTAVQYIALEIVNGNDHAVEVSFEKELWHGGVCSTCGSSSSEHKVTVTVAENERLIGTCEYDDRSLRIYLRMLELKSVRSLSHYELKNISIESAD